MYFQANHCSCDLFTGLFKPRESIIGSDFTGQVEAVGSTVRAFKPGDKIMGFGGVFGCGSHAQYFILPESKAIESMIIMPEQPGLMNRQQLVWKEHFMLLPVSIN